MRLLMTMAVVLLGCAACGPMAGSMDGSTRLVRVRPTKKIFWAGEVITVVPRGDAAWWSDDGGQAPLGREADGTFVFEVAPGPALFRFGTGLWVYGDGDRFEPCTPGIQGEPHFDADAGAVLSLTLVQPAADGDVVLATTMISPLPLLTLDGGQTEVRQSVPLVPLGPGATTLVHVTLDAPTGDFSGLHAVGILDAGVLTEGTVLQAPFEPLAASQPIQLDWDGAALAAVLQAASISLPPRTRFTAMRGDAVLAQTWTSRFEHVSTTLLVPGVPEHFEVRDDTARVFDTQKVGSLRFSWAEVWGTTTSVRPPSQPPGDLTISSDGTRVSWTAPTPAPDAYVVEFSGAFDNHSYAYAYTDQTSMPIPPPLRVAGLKVDVTAMHGGGVTAKTCPWDYERKGAPWWQFTARAR